MDIWGDVEASELSAVCKLTKAESLTSVKPTITVSVCNLGLLQRIKAQRCLEL